MHDGAMAAVLPRTAPRSAILDRSAFGGMMRGQRGSRPASTLPELRRDLDRDGRRPCIVNVYLILRVFPVGDLVI